MSLTYYDAPNYDLIIALLVQAMEETNSSWNDKYDWELFSPSRVSRISNIPLKLNQKEEPLIPHNLPDPSKYEIPPVKVPPRSHLLISKVYSKSTPNIKTDISSSSSSLRSFGSIGTLHNEKEPLTMSSIEEDSSEFDISEGTSGDSTFTYSVSEDDKRPKIQPSPLKPIKTPTKEKREMLAKMPRPDKVLKLTPPTPLKLQKAHARFKSQAGNLLAKKGPADSTNDSYSSVSYSSCSSSSNNNNAKSNATTTPTKTQQQRKDIQDDSSPTESSKLVPIEQTENKTPQANVDETAKTTPITKRPPLPPKDQSNLTESDSYSDLSSDFSDVSDVSSDLSSDDDEDSEVKTPTPAKKKVPFDPIKEVGKELANRKLTTIKNTQPRSHAKSGLWPQNHFKAVLV